MPRKEGRKEGKADALGGVERHERPPARGFGLHVRAEVARGALLVHLAGQLGAV